MVNVLRKLKDMPVMADVQDSVTALFVVAVSAQMDELDLVDSMKTIKNIITFKVIFDKLKSFFSRSTHGAQLHQKERLEQCLDEFYVFYSDIKRKIFHSVDVFEVAENTRGAPRQTLTFVVNQLISKLKGRNANQLKNFIIDTVEEINNYSLKSKPMKEATHQSASSSTPSLAPRPPDLTIPPPIIDLSKPPPNFQHYHRNSPSMPSTSKTNDWTKPSFDSEMKLPNDRHLYSILNKSKHHQKGYSDIKSSQHRKSADRTNSSNTPFVSSTFDRQKYLNTKKSPAMVWNEVPGSYPTDSINRSYSSPEKPYSRSSERSYPQKSILKNVDDRQGTWRHEETAKTYNPSTSGRSTFYSSDIKVPFIGKKEIDLGQVTRSASTWLNPSNKWDQNRPHGSQSDSHPPLDASLRRGVIAPVNLQYLNSIAKNSKLS